MILDDKNDLMYDYTTKDRIADALRVVGAVACQGIYWLLGLVFVVFRYVCRADILSAVPILGRIYSRVAMVLGIFMIFQLTISILQGIVNPDVVNDKKAGFGNIITRIITALVLLVLITPVNINKTTLNDYEKSIKTEGVLFGTLSSVQNRVIDGNVIAKIIMGNGYTQSSDEDEKLEKVSDDFKRGIISGFVEENGACTDRLSAADRKDYKGRSGEELLDGELLKKGCEGVDSKGKKHTYYRYTFNGLLCSLVGIAMIVVFIFYSIDVAQRVFKLVVLKVIAPIPIISYMNPKSGDKGAFQTWVQTFTATYLELFIYLAMFYFIIEVIRATVGSGVNLGKVFEGANAATQFFAWLALIIGLLLFAKTAVPFVKGALGIKDKAGISAMNILGNALGAGAAGAWGAFVNSPISKTDGEGNAKSAEQLAKEHKLRRQGILREAGIRALTAGQKSVDAGIEGKRYSGHLARREASTAVAQKYHGQGAQGGLAGWTLRGMNARQAEFDDQVINNMASRDGSRMKDAVYDIHGKEHHFSWDNEGLGRSKAVLGEWKIKEAQVEQELQVKQIEAAGKAKLAGVSIIEDAQADIRVSDTSKGDNGLISYQWKDGHVVFKDYDKVAAKFKAALGIVDDEGVTMDNQTLYVKQGIVTQKDVDALLQQIPEYATADPKLKADMEEEARKGLQKRNELKAAYCNEKIQAHLAAEEFELKTKEKNYVSAMTQESVDAVDNGKGRQKEGNFKDSKRGKYTKNI